MDLAKFSKKPVIGILRGIAEKNIEPLMECVISAGLETIEITMNTPDAAKLIKKAVKFSKNRLMFGAGTVLDKESLKKALDAGATFIVSPVLVEDVVSYCVKKKIPVFPGALTPQEMYNCWNAGATMVKVFPSKFFAPAYFKEIKAPLDSIKLLACGGVTAENIENYFSNGADAVAFGGSIFRKEWLHKKDFSSIEKNIKKFLIYFSNKGDQP